MPSIWTTAADAAPEKARLKVITAAMTEVGIFGFLFEFVAVLLYILLY
jgi:hypothetical protein